MTRLQRRAITLLLAGGFALCIVNSFRSTSTSSQGHPVVRLGDGWSTHEGFFRWTDGPLAKVYVDIDPAEPAILDLILRPFLLRNVGSQRMEVSLNGQQVAALRLDRPEATLCAIGLPRRLIRARNELRFALPDAHSPWSAGDGDDHRMLGIALHSLRLRRFPVLPPEGVSDLGESTAEPFLGTGWSWAERGFRWTVGHRAELLFALPAGRGQLLQIEFHPFLVPGKHERQRMQVILNERTLANLELVHGADRPSSLTLPGDVLEEENVLRLILPDAVSPASLGRGKDPRPLGVAVHRLILTTRVGDAF